jgi:hypothetical protein
VHEVDTVRVRCLWRLGSELGSQRMRPKHTYKCAMEPGDGKWVLDMNVPLSNTFRLPRITLSGAYQEVKARGAAPLT